MGAMGLEDCGGFRFFLWASDADPQQNSTAFERLAQLLGMMRMDQAAERGSGRRPGSRSDQDRQSDGRGAEADGYGSQEAKRRR